MVHSIELVFDSDTEAAIRRIWADLAAVGIPSQAPASRPHATMVVAEHIASDVDALLRTAEPTATAGLRRRCAGAVRPGQGGVGAAGGADGRAARACTPRRTGCAFRM